MNDEQVWEDLSRFAQAMKRGATVVFKDGWTPTGYECARSVDAYSTRQRCGIREIIEPPQKLRCPKCGSDEVYNCNPRIMEPEPRCYSAECGGNTIVPQKRIRPLNAEEWESVAHCVASVCDAGCWSVTRKHHPGIAQVYCDARATCHPPGFPNDIRKLWVEE